MMIIDGLKIEIIGESDIPMIELSSVDPELPPTIRTKKQIEAVRMYLDRLEEHGQE